MQLLYMKRKADSSGISVFADRRRSQCLFDKFHTTFAAIVGRLPILLSP